MPKTKLDKSKLILELEKLASEWEQSSQDLFDGKRARDWYAAEILMNATMQLAIVIKKAKE